MVNEVKTNFVRKVFSDLINDTIHIKDDISDHLIWKSFLEREASRYCGSNSKNSTIARDALTHGFEYFKLILQQRRTENSDIE